LLCGMHH